MKKNFSHSGIADFGRRALLFTLCLAGGIGSDTSYAQNADQNSIPPSHFVVVDLGTLPDSAKGDCTPYAINNHGQIVGISGKHGFLWERGAMHEIDMIGAMGINDKGQIAGYRQNLQYESLYNACLLSDGRIADLGTDCRAQCINSNGWVAGTSNLSGANCPWSWEIGGKRSSSTGREYGNAEAINDSGQIVGASTPQSTGSSRVPPHATLWDSGGAHNLGALPGDGISIAYGINSSGQIVGSSGYHAALWQNGKVIGLGTLGGTGARARAINKQGWIVGISNIAATPPDKAQRVHMFLWRNGQMLDLNSLTDNDSRYVFLEAIGINDRNQIIVVGIPKDQEKSSGVQKHAFLLNPADGSFGADPDAPKIVIPPARVILEDDSASAIFVALQKRKEAQVKKILALHPEAIKLTDKQGQTSFMYACSLHSQSIPLFLSAGANVNETDSRKETPLHYASVICDAALMRMLLDHGAGVNARDSGGSTPLTYAAGNTNIAAVRLLLDRGAAASAQLNSGPTALFIAAGLANHRDGEGELHQQVADLLRQHLKSMMRPKELRTNLLGRWENKSLGLEFFQGGTLGIFRYQGQAMTTGGTYKFVDNGTIEIHFLTITEVYRISILAGADLELEDLTGGKALLYKAAALHQ